MKLANILTGDEMKELLSLDLTGKNVKVPRHIMIKIKKAIPTPTLTIINGEYVIKNKLTD